jgi:REP element-mobilizing transposase RayT
MPEHIHLPLGEPERGNPSKVMQAIKQGFARRVLNRLRKHRRSGQQQLFGDDDAERVWQRRFYDFNVWSERKRIEKLRYMHRNPVRRGLVERPEQWAWSSFRAYADGESGGERLNQWPAAKLTFTQAGCIVYGGGPSLSGGFWCPHFGLPTFAKTAKVGHPGLFKGKMGHPPGLTT